MPFSFFAPAKKAWKNKSDNVNNMAKGKVILTAMALFLFILFVLLIVAEWNAPIMMTLLLGAFSMVGVFVYTERLKTGPWYVTWPLSTDFLGRSNMLPPIHVFFCFYASGTRVSNLKIVSH
jgi:hypothetical protein